MLPKNAYQSKSRIVTWFLTTFAAWKIRSAHYKPVINVMGLVFYERSWVLVPID